MSLGSVLGPWLPPVLTRSLQRALGRSLHFSAATGSWDEASARSSGYSSGDILSRVVQATREVVAGRAAYERDSVLFHEPAVPFQLLAPLLRHALQHDGQLEVIDFGGSLGSTLRQLQPLLPPLRRLQWHVVEQPGFVDAGRAEFSTDSLHFHHALQEIPALSSAPVFLLSSVLQYLPRPADLVAQLAGTGAHTLVIDRTLFCDAAQDQLCIQHVPARIYPASYPCWALSERSLLQQLASDWQLLLRFPSSEGSFQVRGGAPLHFKGLILERRR